MYIYISTTMGLDPAFHLLCLCIYVQPESEIKMCIKPEVAPVRPVALFMNSLILGS